MMQPSELDLTNARFVDDLFELWKQDPSNVESAWREYFQKWESGAIAFVPREEGPAGSVSPANGHPKSSTASVNGHGAGATSAESGRLNGHAGTGSLEDDSMRYASGRLEAGDRQFEGGDETGEFLQSRVDSLLWAYRDVGYLYADINPLGDYMTPELRYMFYTSEGYYQSLDIKAFGLSDEHLDMEFRAGKYFKPERAPLRELIELFRRTYCGTMGAEVLHIQNKVMRRWLIERLESPSKRREFSDYERRLMQRDLIRAEELEHFIHNNFIGQKRFSLEGGEVLVPALRYLVSSAAQHGLQEIVLGMAHRGRLNVLLNVMQKKPADVFALFTDSYKPHMVGGSGDVKYHLGHSLDITDESGAKIHLSMVANPSHLEAVDPVVEGKARGIQRRRGDKHRKRVMPVLIHGDAAFSGQGVVAETLNLSQLKGYRTGGTVHIIINNQIGFTTASRDARSSFFTTDIAKGLPIPILHVNGDDVEQVLRAIDLAMRYRQKFGYDAIVDIMCYRKLGHNEADEPSFTHPLMYSRIKEHKGTRSIFGKKLHDSGVFSLDEQQKVADDAKAGWKSELDIAKGDYNPDINDAFEAGDWTGMQAKYSHEPVETAISRERLDHIGNTLTAVPDGFGLHPKLKRFVKDRRSRLDEGARFDWALGESLAIGSLLLEGHPVRLSGEDSGRGTFSQRHAVWWDVDSPIPRSYTPLRNLSPQQEPFSVYDSPLSEFAVLGFDYGYSIAQPNILTMWEAQFGDFVNGAQVIIDQFLGAAEQKWFRYSGLVLLLPHGYEGQGPEHSSAHLERFLQLCAEDNLIVCNATTPAQYFHLLRRQMKQPFRKPLVIMTPKSLLRHKEAVSDCDQFISGSFQTVIDDPEPPETVENLLICSGKVYYDLKAERESLGDTRTAIVRVEQLHPRPDARLAEVLSQYRSAGRVAWVQEESRNRGAWTFVRDWIPQQIEGKEIEYVGRPASASPAAGSHREHQEELRALLDHAFTKQ